MARVRTIAKRSVWALAGVSGLLLLVFAFLQTGPGLATLARGIEAVLSSKAQRFEIDGLDGRVPDRLKVAQITVSDTAGRWLSAQDVSLEWRPLRLLGGLLHIEQLTATDLTVARLPASDPASSKDGSARLAVPQLPFALRVDLLGVDAINLQPPVIGTQAGLRLTGSLSTEIEDTIRSVLEVERIDGPPGTAAVKSTYNLAGRTLDLDARVREPADGLIGHLLGVAGMPETELSVTGGGPISNWRGSVVGRSGDAARVDADITVAAGEIVTFGVEGLADIAAFVPPAYRDLARPTVKISANGAWEKSAGVVRIGNLNLSADAFQLALEGRFMERDLTLEASAGASFDGRWLSPLIAPVGLESVNLEVDLSGPLAALQAQFTATVRNLALDPVSIATVSIVGAVMPRDAATAGESTLNVAATIETDGFAAGVAAASGLLGAKPRAFVAGDLDLARGLFNASDVRIDGDAINVSAKGTGSVDGATMDLTVETAIEDLARLPFGPSVALKGNGNVIAEIKAQAGAIAATIRGRAAKFATGVGVLDNLVGGQFDLAASVTGAPGSPWRISDIALDAKNASVRGKIDVAADFGSIDATYTAAVPDLKPLAADLGTDISGRIDSAGAVTGRLDDLAFTGGIDATDLSIAGQAAPRASLLLEAQQLTNEPRGSFALDAEYAGSPTTARGEFALGATALRISSFEAEGPGLRASADLAIPTDGGAIDGAVRAEAFNLTTLAAVFGQSASGQATATVVFGQTDGAPTLQAKLDAKKLVFEFDGERFSAVAATADAQLAYRSQDLDFKSTLNASGISAPQGTLSLLNAAAEGSAPEVRFRADAKGDIGGETDLALEGALTRQAGGTIVSISRFAGQLAAQSLALETPARVRLSGNGISLDPLRITLAGGEIRAQGGLDDTMVTGEIVFQGLPTTLQAVAGLDLPISGPLDGELRLQGSPARPMATLSAAGRGLQFQPEKQSPPVPVELSLTASLRDDLLAFELVGADGDFFSLTSKGQAPLRFAVRPFALGLDPDGGVSGDLEFAGNVAVIEKMFPIDPHRIRGTVRAHARVAGTVAKPIVTGTATLAEGGYENIEIGTLFEKVDATVEFLEGRANVRATAHDGDAGRINLKGHVELAQPRSLDLVLRMDNVTLIRRDEVVAALSGDIFASGGFGDLLVSGQVETNTIEVRLIDALPPEIVRLEVQEIGLRRFGTPASPRDAKDAFAARLEIGVTIPNQLFVRGRGLDSEWQGKLRVFGTTADAEVTGSLSAVRGQYSFAGKTFKLTKGAIGIDERDGEFVAILNVQTEFTDDDFVANVNVTGQATKPNIELTSMPELPRDEVLARILFGRGTGQLSPIEALQLAQAAAELSGVGGSSTGVLDKVRSTLGVDVLQVDGGEGDAGPTVRAGKYVANGVFVGAKQGAGPGASAATVEIELTPNISLESEVGSTGRSRAGVNWQFNY